MAKGQQIPCAKARGGGRGGRLLYLSPP